MLLLLIKSFDKDGVLISAERLLIIWLFSFMLFMFSFVKLYCFNI